MQRLQLSDSRTANQAASLSIILYWKLYSPFTVINMMSKEQEQNKMLNAHTPGSQYDHPKSHHAI